MLGAGEIAFILDHSEARCFVAEEALAPVADRAVAASAGTVTDRVAIGGAPDGWTDIATWFAHAPGAAYVPVADDDPVRLMYTSGTESRPKGALLSSRSLMWQYVTCALDGAFSPDDVELHTLPLYHCAQLDVFLGPDVYLGTTSILLPTPDPAAILRTIEAERVTKFFAPPTVWIGLLRSPAFDDADLSSLRKGYYGASPMPVEVLKEMQQRLPDVQLWNFYGQTEMAPLATQLGPAEQLSHAGSAGRAALNVETRIVDDEDVTVPAGTVGEIVHRSPHATLGYYRNEEKTAEAFRNGWFHSGDLGYVDEDGRLYVVDRKKDMIKTGGENVASREVEEAIYRLEGVAEVAVFGVSHPRWVEAVTAVVVPKEGAELTAEVRAGAQPRGARVLQAPEVRRRRGRPAEEPERQDPQAAAARRARRHRRRPGLRSGTHLWGWTHNDQRNYRGIVTSGDRLAISSASAPKRTSSSRRIRVGNILSPLRDMWGTGAWGGLLSTSAHSPIQLPSRGPQ